MFFPSAKVIIKHPADPSLVLLVKRNNYFEPAGGKAEIDFIQQTAETLEECAIREAYEELGVNIKLEKYLGSYYFFWSIDSRKASSCAVFYGSIVSTDISFTTNKDSCELMVEPAWVSLADIKKKIIPIDPEYIGLQKIFDDLIEIVE